MPAVFVQRFCVYFFSLRLFFVSCLFLFTIPVSVHAAGLSPYSDTVSNSAPGERSDHTLLFTTARALPTGATITFTPDDGYFDIPATDFETKNVALYVATSSGFHVRAASDTPTALEDGVTIVPGTSGSITVTLNNTVSIPASARLRLSIGAHTPNATGTDIAILNPNATGTYAYMVQTDDGVNQQVAKGVLAIIESVHVGDINTHEFIPPVRFNGAPTGTLPGTSQFVQISLETDEFAKCRYATVPNTPFLSMGNEFTSYFTTVHAHVVAVQASTTYDFYVRCTDDEGNINPDDYLISFIVNPPPKGTPGSSGDSQDEGSGTGGGAGNISPGTGVPSGETSAAGGGTGGGSATGHGGGSGGSSGGSGGSGGFEGTEQPYQSGDGLVIITGYAFPQSTIVVLVDGIQAKQATSNAQGTFSITLDAIARGPYTFGVYGIDPAGIKSSTFATTFTVTGGRGSTLSNVNVLPSIKVTPDPVQPNSTAVISGYAIPNATISIENQPDKSNLGLKTFTAHSDASGKWSLSLSTAGFTNGTYKVRAKSQQDATPTIFTNFSGYTFYGVGQAANTGRSSDLNRDGKVNLIDFSILLFWWNTNGGTSNPSADINGDGKVSLTDFSIMIFNWTG